MGYSIAARAKSVILQKKMFEFMVKHYRTASEIFNFGWGTYSRFTSNHLDGCSSLSYDNVKTDIGFDFNACDPERDYIFDVCRWMALKIGRVASHKEGIKAPAIYYDGGIGGGKWPVLPKSQWEGKTEEYRWCLTTDVGHRSIRDKWFGVPAYEDAVKKGKGEAYLDERSEEYGALVERPWKELDNAIEAELQRLDRLWMKLVLV